MWYKDYLKIEFKDRGRGLDGADCWGLIKLIYQDRLGITLPMLDHYENTEQRAALNKIINTEATSNWMGIEKGREQELDVAVFKIMGIPCHVGVVISKGIVIHSQRGSNTTIVHYEQERDWCRRLEGFYRYAKSAARTSTIHS